MGKRESEIGIIINQKAGSRIDQTLKVIAESFESARVYNIKDLENGNIQNISPTIMVVGGDGTVRASVSWLASHDEYPQIFVAGGGSTNTFRSMLFEEGAKTSIEDLKKGEFDGKTIDYKPAIIKGGNEQVYFVMAGGFGRFESGFAKNFEEIRHLRIRPYLRAYVSGIKGLSAGFFSTNASPLLETYTTGPRIGKFNAFKKGELSLKNGRIGLVEIKDESPLREVLRFVLLLTFWQAGVKPPGWVASIRIKDVFNKDGGTDEPTPVNLDGDLKFVPSGKLQVKRALDSFPTAALIWKGEHRG